MSARYLKIEALKIYLPHTAISDGASSAEGFSTISSTFIGAEFISSGLITPYLCILLLLI